MRQVGEAKGHEGVEDAGNDACERAEADVTSRRYMTKPEKVKPRRIATLWAAIGGTPSARKGKRRIAIPYIFSLNASESTAG